jgi:peroxiredoxin
MVKTNNNMIKRILFSALIAVSLSACQAIPTGQPQAPVFDEYINGGDILPIDKITTIDGEVLDLHQLGKRKLVVLFATWCTDSNSLMLALNESSVLKDNNIDVVAISREEDLETISAWRDKRGITIKLATDVDRSIYKRFASGGIPRVITVGENNKIIKMNLAEGQQQLEKIVWQ